jgi:NHL repeat
VQTAAPRAQTVLPFDCNPFGAAVGSAGNLYVADSGNNPGAQTARGVSR